MVLQQIQERMVKSLHWLKKHLGHSVQSVICLLHTNKLPFRHLLIKLDCQTLSPNSFTDVIGKKLLDCEKRPICNFQPVKIDQISTLNWDLSTDQQYLRKITNSVSTGNISASLAGKNPGKLNHLRWLTTANHVLCHRK